MTDKDKDSESDGADHVTGAAPRDGEATTETPDAVEPNDSAAPLADAAPPPADEPQPVVRRGPGILLWFVQVVLIAALAAGGWWIWQQEQRLQSVEQRERAGLASLRDAVEAETTARKSLAGRLDAAAQQRRQLDEELTSLTSRIEASEKMVGRLSDTVQGGRRDLQLAGIEQLLMLANERSLLAIDVRGALLALEAADKRLAALSDPRLFGVREAIADEMAELRAIELPDVSSTALSLGSILRRVDRLPMAGQRLHDVMQDDVPAATDPELAWHQRVVAKVKTVFTDLYTVRRESDNVRRLMPPEAERLTAALLRLKLEGARAALLQRDETLFVDQLDAAIDWLRTQFDGDAASVRSAIEQLERLRSQPIAIRPPEISTSLSRLRQHLDDHGA